VIRRIVTFLQRLGRDEQGVAAVETALVGTVILACLFNVIEVGRYAYTAMQVTAASQAGAQAAITFCEPGQTPVTTECDGASAAIQVAAQSTSLGNAVTLDGAVDEGWYCVTSQRTLHRVASATGEAPSDCDDVGQPSGPPSLYVRIDVTTDFEPIFPGLTIVASFPETIGRTAWMRVK
jgi:Flp pilus assembly protein TadG